MISLSPVTIATTIIVTVSSLTFVNHHCDREFAREQISSSMVKGHKIRWRESRNQHREPTEFVDLISPPTPLFQLRSSKLSGTLRLFQYIQGANLNYSRIAMTAPVLTSIVPGAGPLHSSAYVVCFYIPGKFQASPPLPLAKLNLKPKAWDSHCIAVRKFFGFAMDNNIVEQAEKLATSLSRSPWGNCTSDSNHAYSIAQYNSPFRFIGRVNEVWVDINGCQSGGTAAY